MSGTLDPLSPAPFTLHPLFLAFILQDDVDGWRGKA